MTKVPSNGRVAIGMCDPGTWVGSFGMSLHQLHRHAVNHRLSGNVLRVRSGANISKARNTIVGRFLDDTRDEWLLMLDTDLEFAPTAIARLLDTAHPTKAPVVAGWYFAQDGRDTRTGLPGMAPLILVTNDAGKMSPLFDWPREQLVAAYAVATGLVLMHRSALELVRARAGDPTDPLFARTTRRFAWYSEEVLDDSWTGEDVVASLRLRACGVPLACHTGAFAVHHKQYAMTMEAYSVLRRDQMAVTR